MRVFGLAFFLFSLLIALPCRAHQVPNMTIEVAFDALGAFEMKVNLDPRVVISTQPTSLPPVPASWFLEQSPEQRAATFQQAKEHLDKTLTLNFGTQRLALPEIAWQAMDGATNLPVKPETTEVHLLATLPGRVPESGGPFVLGFGAQAQVSLILLLSRPGQPEPKVLVLFPGESSRPYELPMPARESKPMPETAISSQRLWLPLTVLLGLAMLGLMGWQRVRRRRRL